jgi:hypothetical protein
MSFFELQGNYLDYAEFSAPSQPDTAGGYAFTSQPTSQTASQLGSDSLSLPSNFLDGVGSLSIDATRTQSQDGALLSATSFFLINFNIIS